MSRIAFHLCFMGLLLSSTVLRNVDGHAWKRQLPMPCKNLVLYFHDILYNGKNIHNATAALVAAPAWGNLTTFAEPFKFGDVVVFDDPITLDNNLHSPPVGRAQGFYLYNMKTTYNAWLGFTFVLNSTDYKGTITFNGADPPLVKYRDISVVGGTGDFLMARGIATLSTDAIEGNVYFRLRVNITLYECY
uniref:Dirigent protein n=1 Tax=Thuja plicata TaxID=3316 RepID=Q9SDR5_THUPL|nr:dirigent-like protein [Thuja plicata]